MIEFRLGRNHGLEVHDFVLHHYHKLNFGERKDFSLQIKRKNPKRTQREARREMEKIKETQRPSTLAQDYMREELEKKKKEKKCKRRVESQAHEEKKFAAKQQKKREKRRGH